MVRTVYKVCRWTGYLAGVLGLFCVVATKRGAGPEILRYIGPLLLLVMFISFFVTYVLYIVGNMKRKAANRARIEGKKQAE